MLELCFLLQICVVYAVPSFLAQSTSFVESQVIAPSPTPPPRLRSDLKRDSLGLNALTLDVDDNVCGWVNGDMHVAFSCLDTHATCFWDADKKLVGCGSSELMPFVTSCYDFASASNCDDACVGNPSNYICSSTAPYCNIVNFPDSYSMFPCGKTQSHQLDVEVTFNGEHTPVELPRYFTPSSSLFTSPTATAIHKKEMVNTGSIIAAAIGGAVLLIGLPFGVKMYTRRRKWRKMQRPREVQEREMRRQWEESGNPYVRNDLPVEPLAVGGNFLFSQDWHGKTSVGKATNG